MSTKDSAWEIHIEAWQLFVVRSPQRCACFPWKMNEMPI